MLCIWFPLEFELNMFIKVFMFLFTISIELSGEMFHNYDYCLTLWVVYKQVARLLLQVFLYPNGSNYETKFMKNRAL